jgi:hypothetical protein
MNRSQATDCTETYADDGRRQSDRLDCRGKGPLACGDRQCGVDRRQTYRRCGSKRNGRRVTATAMSCNQSGVLCVYAMGKSRTREAPRPRIPRSDCPKAARTCLCVRAALFARYGYSPQYRRGAAYGSANRAGSASPVLTQPGIPEYRLEALAVESKLHDKPFTGWPKSGARGALQCVIFVTNLKIAIANDTFLSSFCPDSRAGTQSSRTKGSESPTTLGKRRRGGDGR